MKRGIGRDIELKVGGPHASHLVVDARHRMPMLLVVDVLVHHVQRAGVGADAVQTRRLEVHALRGEAQGRVHAHATTCDREVTVDKRLTGARERVGLG